MYRAFAPAVLLVLVAASAAACSSNAAVPASSGAASSVAPAAATTASAQPVALTADQVIAKFKAAKLPVGSVLVFTAANDPNHLLGRPNGYVSKDSWTDTRVSPDQAKDTTPGSVDLGGSVEVFATAAQAQARETYIQGILKADPMLGTEYDYVVGDALIRVSQVLTPAQAQAYDAAAQG